jgi:hypothetical protein
MNKIKAAASHHEREIAELRANAVLTIKYLKAALESLTVRMTVLPRCWHCAPSAKRMTMAAPEPLHPIATDTRYTNTPSNPNAPASMQ